MLTAFNPVTRGRPCPLDRLAPIVRAAGFDGLELSIEEAAGLAERDGSAALERALDGLTPITFGLPVEWRASSERFEAELAGLDGLARLAAGIGQSRCCTWIPPENPALGRRYATVAGDRLVRCAEVLAGHGIALALEFLAPRHLISDQRLVWFSDAGGALAAVEALEARTAPVRWGLVLDAMHLHISGLDGDGLAAIPVGRIANVQLCDAPLDAAGRPPDRALLRNNASRLPGTTGVIDAEAIVAGLSRLGYAGPVSVEVFDPALAGRPVEDVVGEAFRRLSAVLGVACAERAGPA
jgi:sugar phosphate isomerase/epimerase